METIWLEIDGSEMMATDFAVFLEFLSAYHMKYTSYYSEDEKIVMEVVGDITKPFNRSLASLMYSHPISELHEKPYLSDIDLIDEISST